MERFPNLEYTEEDLKYAYRTFQEEKNGFVSADEIRFVVGQLGELSTREIEDMISYYDVNNDNFIEYIGF